tara:strand:+ start:834 stop:1970 length:1137 start_codon:yes stop_codon:yes gene_type:complete
MAEQYVQLSGQYLPDYQERFLKDLLANVYQVDPETGQPTGIAATSPLYGVPVTDEEGNPVYELDQEGNVRYDQYGEPIQQVQGGVPRPDIMQFTPAQQRAIELMTGTVDPETGERVGGGIGLYQPMMEQAASTLGEGLESYRKAGTTLDSTTGAYDPTSYKEFYDPFVEEVIDTTQADIQRAGDIAGIGDRAQAVRSGAFGGSRQAVTEQELQRNIDDRKARVGAQLRSQAYTGAQQQAQSAFENQMNRGQTASQLFGSLGQGIAGLGVKQGALGEAAQSAAQRDINALFNVGSLEQAQRQAEYDVQRAGAIEEAYEPFQRFSYMSDIFRGVPSTAQTMTMSSIPRPNPVSSFLGNVAGYSAQQQLGGLGGLRNVSGV